MKRRIFSSFAVLISATMIMAGTAMADMPKYVFFFLGDGMSASQIQIAEAYLTQVNGGEATEAEDLLLPENRLNMSKMPVAGMQTTYDAHALMTDSASSATAFSCGIKTVSGTIGMDDTKTTSYKSVAQLAHEKGMNVGVISSVSLDHATPAAYYASVASRGSYDLIDIQMAETGFEFFGGGGLKTDAGDFEGNGYTILNTRDDIMALMGHPQEKVVCINPWLQDGAAMPYAIDRPDTNVSLREMTEVAISCLEKSTNKRGKRNGGKSDGFFLMVEGGKIDWACHANDAAATIGDTLAFDDAIGAALEFYYEHPNDTLIVVTGDHETGGMTVGHATTRYSADYSLLLGQTCSFTYFDQNQWPAHKALYGDSYVDTDDNLESNQDMIDLMFDAFGLVYGDLNVYQMAKLEAAYDVSMTGSFDRNNPEHAYLYGGYEPITVTITHILNEITSIGWTSYSHTGVPVPVFATGADANLFSGFYDNTDIAKKIAKAMNIREPLPVEK